jgi:hypothetical protein
MKNKTLIIWLTNGNTCKFEQVENFQDGSEELNFSYFGVFTQVRRDAVFYRGNIAGYALEED